MQVEICSYLILEAGGLSCQILPGSVASFDSQRVTIAFFAISGKVSVPSRYQQKRWYNFKIFSNHFANLMFVSWATILVGF